MVIVRRRSLDGPKSGEGRQPLDPRAAARLKDARAEGRIRELLESWAWVTRARLEAEHVVERRRRTGDRNGGHEHRDRHDRDQRESLHL